MKIYQLYAVLVVMAASSGAVVKAEELTHACQVLKEIREHPRQYAPWRSEYWLRYTALQTETPEENTELEKKCREELRALTDNQ